jgi:hypothetical protein
LSRRATATTTALVLLLSLCTSAFAASVPVELSAWSVYDQPYTGIYAPPAGSWEVESTGTAVTQTVNGLPTFFVAPGDIADHRFTATLGSPGPDDDFFGIALGFSTGMDADYLLIDWRRSAQGIDWHDGTERVTGTPGLAVSRVTGVATLNELWGHVDSPANPDGGVTQLARARNLGFTGWVPGDSYDFVVEYTTTSLDVWVDGSLELHLEGIFPSGPVALYDFSEPGLTASRIAIETLNDPPQVLDGGASDVSRSEGQLGTTSGAFADPDGDVLTLTCLGECTGFVDSGGGAWSWSQALVEGPDSFTVDVTASDGQLSTTDSFDVTVTNVAPVITSTSSLSDTHDLGQALTVSSDFTDAGLLDTHTARFYWGDGTSTDGSVSESPGAGSATADHMYDEPGFYTVSVTVWDDDGDWDKAVLGQVFVFDPDTFVTGGGWVSSPARAWLASPSTEGKGTFGFVARYDRSGSVRGSLEFQLHKGVALHATQFDYLLINGGIAQFTGSGTVNGASGYDFTVVATDERYATSSRDLFWIEISRSGETIYNGGAYPAEGLPIVGLGVQIHQK